MTLFLFLLLSCMPSGSLCYEHQRWPLIAFPKKTTKKTSETKKTRYRRCRTRKKIQACRRPHTSEPQGAPANASAFATGTLTPSPLLLRAASTASVSLSVGLGLLLPAVLLFPDGAGTTAPMPCLKARFDSCLAMLS